MLLGELPVALVLAGHRHDRAGAVRHEDVVGDEERDRGAVERVHDLGAEPHAALGAILGRALDLGLPGDLGPELLDRGPLLRIGHQRVDQRMLGRQHRVRHAERRVGPGREHADLQLRATDHRQVELGALALADPVALHRHHAFGPAGQPVAPRQQFLGVVGDLEEPSLDLALDDLGVAAPAAAGLHLLVGQHRLARRAPVHAGALAIGQAALQHLDEDELLPLVIRGIAGRELAVPVVGDPHLAELGAHVVDVLVGPDRRMHAVLDGRVLGGQPEGVPAHRVQHVEAAHPLVAGEQVADRVDAHVAHVDAARRVREHLEAVELRPGRVLDGAELPALLPAGLPLGFDLGEGVAIRRHDWRDFTQT